jgi:hypothetical protein
MFLRRCERKKTGKQHTYWALVESHRTARGSRQTVVAYIDELRSTERNGWVQLARRLGRIQQRYWRASGAFDVKITAIDKPVGKARLKVSFERSKRWSDWTELSEGCYLLRTNLTQVDPKTLWRRYIQLTEAEWAFRIAKDELVIRPIWHQRPDRVKAHVLVCFLAYVLWKSLAQWMRRAGLGDAPRTVLQEFARINSSMWSCLLAVEPAKQARRFGFAASQRPMELRKCCSIGWG